MFVVRKYQLDAFSQALVAEFEARMSRHLARFFPHQREEIGDLAFRSAIHRGVERAKMHGLAGEYDICLYLHVMFALGLSFDEDPALEWARTALADKALAPSTRISVLHDRVFGEVEEESEEV